ncbi:MAG: hypothetical protein AAGK93_07910 [Pseudomonadota bacterium]
MTAIAWKDGLLAVDSLTSWGPFQRATPGKTDIVSGWVITGSGCSNDREQIVRYFKSLELRVRQGSAEDFIDAAWPKIQDDDSHLVFWRPDQAMVLRKDSYPEISTLDCEAFGCHSYLLGALHSGLSAQDAVAQACWNVEGCGFPVHVFGDRDGELQSLHMITSTSEVPKTTKTGMIWDVQPKPIRPIDTPGKEIRRAGGDYAEY